MEEESQNTPSVEALLKKSNTNKKMCGKNQFWQLNKVDTEMYVDTKIGKARDAFFYV